MGPKKKYKILIGSMVIFISLIVVLGYAFYWKEDTKTLKNQQIETETIQKTDTVSKTESSTESSIEKMDIKDTVAEEVFEIEEISDEIFARIKGKSYKLECDIPLEALSYLKISYYGFDEEVHVGEMIVNSLIAEDTLHIFKELYEAKYPIERMELIDEYDADDNASMEANNTSAFNFRYIDGTTIYSNHAKGFAIDINPLYNPYVREKNGKEEVLPAIAKPYANRSRECEYYIEEKDICYQTFKKYGFSWGGDWNGKKDYQHFEKILEE